MTGPLTAAMVASARCFVQPQYKLPSLLRAVLRDEYITWHKKVGSSPRLKLGQGSKLIYMKILLSSTLYHLITISFSMFLFQKQDETNPGSQPVDMEGDMLIQMVNKAVSAIMTRLQSKQNLKKILNVNF